jgi:flavin reductase (DIM6/NTAB) family NADH-FMN oxidoreductase RutF
VTGVAPVVDAPPVPGGRAAAADVARQALRRFASGVTVLTTTDGGRPHGTTVSAVVAVSRDPLVVGVCLRTPSAFTRMVTTGRTFSINVLAEEQAKMAVRFADPLRRPGPEQFRGIGWRPDPHTGAPLVDGCLAHLSCRMTGCTQVGDHDLILAEVVAGLPGDGSPLLTYGGRLASVPAPSSDRSVA